MLRSLMDRVPGMRLPSSHKMDGAPLLFSPSYSLMSPVLFSSLFLELSSNRESFVTKTAPDPNRFWCVLTCVVFDGTPLFKVWDLK